MDPAVRDAGRQQADRRGQPRLLEGHPGREGSRRGAVPARERAARGLPHQLPRQRDGVQPRALPPGGQLGRDVRDAARDEQGAEAADRRAAPAGGGERTGDAVPEQAVVGTARQARKEAVEDRGLAACDGVEEAAVEGLEAGQRGDHAGRPALRPPGATR